MGSTIWQCIRCEHILDGNPRLCPYCSYTVYRPVRSERESDIASLDTRDFEALKAVMSSMGFEWQLHYFGWMFFNEDLDVSLNPRKAELLARRFAQETERQANTHLLDLIGPNEPVDGFSKDPNRSIRPAARNEVRDELRAKVKAWAGGKS